MVERATKAVKDARVVAFMSLACLGEIEDCLHTAGNDPRFIPATVMFATHRENDCGAVRMIEGSAVLCMTYEHWFYISEHVVLFQSRNLRRLRRRSC